MLDRRAFALRSAATLGALSVAWRDALAAEARRLAAPPAQVAARLAGHHGGLPPATLAEDEAFWAEVRGAFTLRPDVINLDHGWTNPTTNTAVEALVAGLRQLQALPAEELPRLWFEVTNTEVRAALAEAMGVPGSELALVRNATEALDIVLLGLPLRAGDEIVCSPHDYYAMLDALEQRRDRDGVVLRLVRPPLPAPSLDALAEAYEAAIGPRTKLVLLTHPSNLTGQLLPVTRIAAAAHRAGAEVVVDGAQSLGLLDEPVSALGCDYYGASLHKWLGTPVGFGVLWMRPAHVAKVWPLVPPGPVAKGMERFEWIGTSATYIEPAALPALAMHRTLGPARKLARLRHLAALVRERVAAAVPQARFYTTGPAMQAGLTVFEVPGTDPAVLQRALRERHGVLTQAMTDNPRAPEIRGLRVSPNVYTSVAELDRFAAALRAVVRG